MLAYAAIFVAGVVIGILIAALVSRNRYDEGGHP